MGELIEALEDSGPTPADPGFYAAARQCVIDRGIVRRRKVDVAADIPARRIADLHVELDGAAGRSVRAAERDLARRMVVQYQTALAARSADAAVEAIDRDLVRRVARSEPKQAMTRQSGDNVFTMMRQTQAIDRSHRIGQTEPVTAWRIIAAQTLDARIAELIDSKAGLAARALDGSDEEIVPSADVQLETLVALLADALPAQPGQADAPGS